jgi:hypothetical protein
MLFGQQNIGYLNDFKYSMSLVPVVFCKTEPSAVAYNMMRIIIFYGKQN